MTLSFPPRRSSDLPGVLRGAQRRRWHRGQVQGGAGGRRHAVPAPDRGAAVQRDQGQRGRLRADPRDGRGERGAAAPAGGRSEEHTSELQSLMRISYAVFCLKKKKKHTKKHT